MPDPSEAQNRKAELRSVALTLRADAFNLTNTPYFTNPDVNINSGTFGRILGTVAGSNRVVTVSGRIEF